MNKGLIRIENVSNYWYSTDNLQASWRFEWKSIFDRIELEKKQKQFIENFVVLTKKYKILLPSICFFKEKMDIENILEDYVLNNKVFNQKAYPYIRLFALYNLRHINEFSIKEIFPSKMYYFKDNKIVSDILIDILYLHTIKDVNMGGFEPIKILNFANENIISIDLQLRSDAFFPIIWNRKISTWVSENANFTNLSNRMVDNTELFFYNTTRFNSFLRGLKELCISYGADFSIEKDYLIPNVWNENGILYDGEIIYFEDVQDIVPFKE